MTDLILPPLLNPIETAEPFSTAVEQVRQRKAGAGDLFWTSSNILANFAIVLEPDVNYARAVEMIPLALVALSDCLAVVLPPQVAVQFRDDHNVIVNGGLVGGIDAAMSLKTANKEIPDWLVLSINVALRQPEDAGEPGLQPDITTLDEEGWEEPDLPKFIETYARHFLSWMATWDDDGFDQITRAYAFKSENKTGPDMNTCIEAVTMFESKSVT